MSVARNIAWKYLRFFRGSRSVMAMTIISIIGIAIGVATLTVTVSIANGFRTEYRKAILDFSAHVVLLSTEEISDEKEVMRKLDGYKVDNQEAAEWKSSEYLIDLLKVLEYISIKIDDFYFAIQYNDKIPITLYSLLNKIHPKNLSQSAYAKGLYPKSLVNKIVEVLKISGKGIVGVNPFLYREGLMIHEGQIRGIVIKGVDPNGLKAISNMTVSFSGNEGNKEVILGSFLAAEMNLKKGDKVRLMLPEHWKETGPEGFEEFDVAGIFESGMYDFDSQFALMDLRTAQKIFDAENRITGVEIKLDDWRKSPLFALRLEENFKYPIYASDWMELNRSLFEAVKLEKLMFIIIMGALVIVAAFNIIGTVMLRILYKTSDISILKALGTPNSIIKRIFVLQGIYVGVVGTFIGIIFSLIFIWSVTEFKWVKIPAEIYLIKTLPVCISWPACVMIAAFSILVCWFTSRVASNKILELSIVKGLHRP